MDGADGLAPGSAHRRVVRLRDGTLLNRYWDDRDVPREESYREDVATAQAATRPAPQVYRDLRAAAESGWDFSSRWLADGRTLATIRTTDLVPVDLNSIMAQLETVLADAHAAAGADEQALAFADPRRAAQGGRATPSLGRGAGRVRRLSLARGPAQRRAHRRDAWPPCSSASPTERRRGAWRRRSAPSCCGRAAW